MIDWEVTTGGLRVSDRRSAVEIAAPDWRGACSDVSVPRPVDTTLSGQVSTLGFGAAVASATSLTDGDSYEFVRETATLPTDRYLLDVDTPIATSIRFDGSATVCAPDDTLTLAFADRRAVTLGFRSTSRRPDATLTIPPTVEGFATALSHLHACHRTTGPTRSVPTMRGHPPLIEFGDRVRIPDAVRETTAHTGIELLVPDDLETLLVTAPLAYYLQARVGVDDRSRPVLRAPAADIEHELPAQPDLESEVATLLRGVFYLDCLVRRVGPPLSGVPDPTTMGIDPDETIEASPAERLASYLSVAFDDLALPDWHLAAHLPPEPERARALPFLLDRLSLVYRPRTGRLDTKELLERSLTDFYRRSRSVASVDVVRPELDAGRVHAWLADSTPIDVFNATTRAFENGIDARDTDEFSFVVVRNDPEMSGEYTEAARIYEDHTADLPVDVTVHQELARAELAAVFEEPNAFVHYIGHCDADGLRCTDGHLSAASLTESNARTFFLNACGTFHEGTALVERGSVAGGVTFSKVLNDQAATVGATFARLLVHGFAIDRAMQLARRRIMMGKNYVVVGDGTHVLADRGDRNPATITIEPADDGTFTLTYDVLPTGTVGGIYRPEGVPEDRPQLTGTTATFHVTRSDLLELLSDITAPIVCDGTFFWPEEFADQLAE